MTIRLRGLGAATAVLALSAVAFADTAKVPDGVDATETGSVGGMEALSELVAGRWSGRGEVLVKMTQTRPYDVKCDFEGGGESDGELTMAGECGALFVKRGIKFALAQTGDALEGTYDASLRTGVAALSGTRTGDMVDLRIVWNGEVNGDTEASMTIERQGEDALRILVRDVDPATGEERVTTDLSLTRN